MDLALNLGMSLAEVKKLSEKELNKWALYASKYRLPLRRRDLYMAQIAMCISRGQILEETALEDFLFDPPEDQVGTAFDNDAEALGFNPDNPEE